MSRAMSFSAAKKQGAETCEIYENPWTIQECASFIAECPKCGSGKHGVVIEQYPEQKEYAFFYKCMDCGNDYGIRITEEAFRYGSFRGFSLKQALSGGDSGDA